MKIPHFSKIHNRFQLNGHPMDRETLLDVAYSFVKEGEAFEQELGDFLFYWLDNQSRIRVKTSGATGNPKNLEVSKQAMVHSAVLTGEYFNLEPGQRALHCLPASFIAGKMMFVRAMILGLSLDVIPPTTTPQLSKGSTYDFAAMIPVQVSNCLSQLKELRTLIIGGAPLPSKLRATLETSHTGAYETYGMTETLSHVAIRPITSTHKVFTTLPSVGVATDEEGCLVITAPHVSLTPITTKDVVDCQSATSFTYLGRKDFMINSGGRKFHPEQLEEKLSPLVSCPFFIHKMADDTYGERPILVLEGEKAPFSKADLKAWGVLEKWELPEQIICLKSFKRTSSGKVQRVATLEKALG